MNKSCIDNNKKVIFSKEHLGAMVKMTTRPQVTVYATLLFLLDKTLPTDYIEAVEEITGFSVGTIEEVLKMLILDNHIFYEDEKIRIVSHNENSHF